MNDVMLDIETLDTRPSAVVLSIAAVRFDINNVDSFSQEFQFHAHIDIDSSMAYGRTVSGSTLMWWMSQNEDARSQVLYGKRKPMKEVVEQLGQFIKSNDRVWGNGAAFDNVIASSLFKDVGIKQPWRYSNDMCYRTMKNLYPDVKPPVFVGVQHDAMDDAVHQARHLQLIFASMK